MAESKLLDTEEVTALWGVSSGGVKGKKNPLLRGTAASSFV